LAKACLITAPALDVDLWCAEDARDATCILRANDWRTIPAKDVLTRLTLGLEPNHGLAALLEDVVEESGEIVGRAAIASSLAPCVITVGGLRASTLTGICGLLTGQTSVAARDEAAPSCSPVALHRWAQRQVQLLSAHADRKTQWTFADALARFGADVTALAAGNYKGKYLSIPELATLFRTSSHVFLVDQVIPEEWEDEFPDPVVVIEERSRLDHPLKKFRGSLADQVVAALARSWRVSDSAVEEASELHASVSYAVSELNAFDVDYSKIVRPGSK
jgi:hypothetical protein